MKNRKKTNNKNVINAELPKLLPENNAEIKPESRQGTAIKAIEILIKKGDNFHAPNKKQRINILIAFAKINKVIYGKAFDIIKIKENKKINLNDLEEVEKNLNHIIIYEIKSTSKKNISTNFEKYFFGLSTAELLVAQNLRDQFKFIFVNTNTEETLELNLKQLFERAKGIYPVWSIQF